MDPGFVALFIALIAPVGAYLVASRKLSGQIKDSDATELWAESKSIREWATQRIKELNAHIDLLELRLAEVERQNFDLVEENRKLKLKFGIQRREGDLK